MATRLPNASQQASADAVVDLVDAGTGTTEGKLRFYSGAQPADADSAPGGTLLLEIDLANPAFGDASSAGVATALGTLTATGEAGAGAGTDAVSFRVIDRDGATVWDGAVRGAGDTDNGEEAVLDNANIASGQTVTLSSFTYTAPASAS